MRMTALPTNSLPVEAAKRVAEYVLWGRVAAQGRLEKALVPTFERPQPASVPPTAVLSTRAQVDASVEEAHRLRLPLHPTREKNWDALGAVAAVLAYVGPGARVLDAGAARYSIILPWLRLYGVESLLGLNIEFDDRQVRHGSATFRHGDITATGLPDASLDAVTCMSVIEHGVDVPAFLAEASRVLRPGGVLVISTDYDQSPPDTSRQEAYGQPVHIFGPEGIERLVKHAEELGFSLVGDLALSHDERPVHWHRHGLDYTFLLLTFTR